MTTDMPARILRLLALLQTRREWSGAELSDRLGVTVRTVRRDMDRLRDLGYPVDSVSGHAGGYRLASGADMPPLLLDDDEAVALTVALRTAAGHVTGFEEAALRALAKLEQVLPARLRIQAAALQDATTTLAWDTPSPRAAPAVLTTLAAACRDHEIITFDYTTRHHAHASRRVEPHRLVAYGSLWYLIAHDTHQDDWRIYRLDRITDPAPTGFRVPARELPAPGPDPAAYLASKIAGAPARYRAVATVQAPAETVRARTGALADRVRAVTGTTCTLDTSSDSLTRIAQTLTALDAEYTLDADPAVTHYLRRTTRRTANALND
ncbi:helix-turn-helix transcriptional regulator [Streptomyces sp. NPDC016309]|uniref:helix-turn-helix transcriptional regulator n=1 Tax=Streptomyces sp. NPDC016309 TaxID=3364965 RepID=UPI0036F8C338